MNVATNIGAERVLFNSTLKLRTIEALFDWHPFAEKFKISFGLIHNQNELSGIIVPTRTYTFGGLEYEPDKMGTINGLVKFKKNAPYFGIGLGNAVGAGQKVGFAIDIGAVFQGPPQVYMEADGLITPTAEQAQSIQNDLSGLKVYPVVTLGFTFKLF